MVEDKIPLKTRDCFYATDAKAKSHTMFVPEAKGLIIPLISGMVCFNMKIM